MPPAPEPLHLLIPDAVPPLPEGAPLPDLPSLPALDALLARLRRADTIEVDEDSPATPFEAALARANRLPGEPGRQPWAAFESGAVGTPCAWLKPCHWQLGLDHVTLVDPAALALTEDESRALLAAVQPLLAEDGVALRYVAPEAWLAQGELFRGLVTWSMDRAVQRPLTREVLALAPTAAQSAHLRRLQTEVQMLLYHHPVNEAREQGRRWPVNALWIAGAGQLDAPLPPAPHVLVEPRLAQLPPVSTAGDYARAWQAIDAGTVAQLRRVLDGGGDARLTLCGPRRAIAFAPARGLGARISSLFSPQRLLDVRQQL
ncbi:phosphoglycerate mutase [Ottowia sp.]|uniref:phosphoglycerate mutase n=1 Tax=Ottowia sp. TaxID=1898956 RepID=UPI0039E3AB3C